MSNHFPIWNPPSRLFIKVLVALVDMEKSQIISVIEIWYLWVLYTMIIQNDSSGALKEIKPLMMNDFFFKWLLVLLVIHRWCHITHDIRSSHSSRLFCFWELLQLDHKWASPRLDIPLGYTVCSRSHHHTHTFGSQLARFRSAEKERKKDVRCTPYTVLKVLRL